MPAADRRRIRALFITLLVAAMALGGGGCGGRAPAPAATSPDASPRDPASPYLPSLPPLPPLSDAPCPGGGPSARGTAGFTLAVPGTVDPAGAPLPATEAERHVFAACYETLVRIGCDGRLEPWLAERWDAFDGGRRWVFHLRPDARFWDGTPLGAVHVVEAWRRAETLCRQRGEPSPFVRFDPRGSALQVVAARSLAIRLEAPADELPWLLAHPALAITGDPDGRGWLAGSGPLQPLPGPGAALALVPASSHPRAPSWPQIELLLGDDLADPRDLLDRGAHALVTRQQDVVAYFRGLPRARVEPLPWDRTYYLVVPTEAAGHAVEDRRRWASGWEPLELAREVVQQVAAPTGFFPLEPRLNPCPVLPPPVPVLERPSLAGRGVVASRDADLIVWPANDPDAGRLAGRLAAVAARPLRPGTETVARGPLTPPPPPLPGTAPEAVAVPAAELVSHVQAARAGALVVPWPQRWALPCDDVARLLSLADWLVAAALEPGPDIRGVPPGATAARPLDDAEPAPALAAARRLERLQAVQPLLRTRATLVRVPELDGLTCDHDGTLRLWTASLRI